MIDKGTPILQKLAEDVREKVIEASKEIIANLEKKVKLKKKMNNLLFVDIIS